MPLPLTKKAKDKRFKRRYLSKSQAKRYLQLDNNEFKRILIFKGVFPRVPKKLLSSQAKHKIYYSTKEIKKILEDPIIEKFREYQTHMKEVSKKEAMGTSTKLEKPYYDLSSSILERYPTFKAALADISDPLSMVVLYSILPPAIYSDTTIEGHSYLTTAMHKECIELANRWHSIVQDRRALKKGFISIKGYYYQASFGEYTDKPILWVEPHNFVSSKPSKAIEHRIMLTYLEFYLSYLKFVCFKLENDKSIQKAEHAEEVFAGANSEPPKHRAVPADSDNAFEKLKFYVSRESNPHQISFVLANLGCEIASSYKEPEITHYVIDRPAIPHNEERLGHVDYVQPQYVFDCLNADTILPIAGFGIGEKCPPHLSPFDVEKPQTDALPVTEEEAIESPQLPVEQTEESDSEAEEIREKPFRTSAVAKKVNEQLNFSKVMRETKRAGNHKSDENFGMAQAANVSKRVRDLYKAAKHSQKITQEKEANVQKKRAKIQSGQLGISSCGKFLKEKKQ